MNKKQFVVLCALQLTHVSAFAAPQCKDGFQPREDVCISQCMTDYIACVVTSGGNKQDVYNQIADQLNRDGKIKATGSEKGVMVEGKVGLQLSGDDETGAIHTFSSHFYPDAMKNCLEALRKSCIVQDLIGKVLVVMRDGKPYGHLGGTLDTLGSRGLKFEIVGTNHAARELIQNDTTGFIAMVSDIVRGPTRKEGLLLDADLKGVDRVPPLFYYVSDTRPNPAHCETSDSRVLEAWLISTSRGTRPVPPLCHVTD
jgi:hypothetical protein